MLITYFIGCAVISVSFILAILLWLCKDKFVAHKKDNLRRGKRVAPILMQRREISFNIGFERLGLVLPSGKTVLDGVSGVISSGRTTAVMGPSGSGKTTFLTTLAGRSLYGKTVGFITINSFKDSLLKYPKLVGFVPQEDIMHRDCTVAENLLFSADTRLPSSMSSAEKREMVESVIELLGLTDIRDSPIGDENIRGISGGQRKRVNIGIELVADPTVLFLDEPTSGLDSASSKEICSSLRQVAVSTGMTIVAVIHAPRWEIFEMFDDVLLLGKGGCTVYLGPTNKALEYFTSMGFHPPANTNPADFMLDVISGDIPRENAPDFRPSDLPRLWEAHSRKDRVEDLETPVENIQDMRPNDTLSDESPLLPRGEADNSEIGSWTQFFIFFGCYTVMPLLLPIAIFVGPHTKRAIAGATFGVCFAFVSVFLGVVIWLAVLMSQWPDASHYLTLLPFGWPLLWGIAISVLAVKFWRQDKDMRLIAQFLSGTILNFFYLPVIWFKPVTKPSEKLAAVTGFGAALAIGLGGLVMPVAECIDTDIHGSGCNIGQPLYTASWVLAFALTVLIVSYSRYRLLVTKDRATAGFLRQLYSVFKRAMTQQLRYPLGLTFDILLPIFSATFLGIMFHRRKYTGPLLSQLFPTLGNFTCPPQLPANWTNPIGMNVGSPGTELEFAL